LHQVRFWVVPVGNEGAVCNVEESLQLEELVCWKSGGKIQAHCKYCDNAMMLTFSLSLFRLSLLGFSNHVTIVYVAFGPSMVCAFLFVYINVHTILYPHMFARVLFSTPSELC
jgi:hypothetical protein